MKFILFLLLLILAVIAVFFLKTSAGVILITLPHWTIQSPFWLGVLIILIAFILLHYFLRFFSFIGNIPARWRQRKAYKKVIKTLNLTKKALSAFIENDWHSASKYFYHAADYNDDFIEAEMMSAKLLMEKNHAVSLEYLLENEGKFSSDQKQLVHFLQAENEIHRGKYESAIKLLTRLPQKTAVLLLLKKAYTELNDYKGLKNILPCLKKTKTLDEKQFNQLEEKTYIEELNKYSHDLDSLGNCWNALPRYLKKNQTVFFAYAKDMISLKQDDKIASLLIKSINNCWNDDLVSLFGQLTLQNQNKQLKIAENWKTEHPSDPALLLSLARIALRLKLWKTTETYLKELTEKHPSNEAYQLFGDLYELMGDKQKELDFYKRKK